MGLSRRWHVLFLLLIGSLATAQQPARTRVGTSGAARITGQRPVPHKQSDAEQRTARYLDSIRDQPSLLLEFVQQLPKGADLHNHLTGAIYAESFINFAAADNLCIERRTLKSVAPDKTSEGQKPACDETKGNVPASRAFADPVLYRDIIDAWSMRHYTAQANDRSAHDHFFDTFGKFSAAKDGRMGEMLAEAVSRAGQEHLTYVEFILSPDNGAAANFGQGMGWTGDMAAQRQKLIEKQIERVVADARMNVDQAEAKMRSMLRCGSMNADPGCSVTVRYLYEVHRGLGRDQVFAEMVTGFEMGTADPRLVGINLVMPEDGLVEMRDFTPHMQMLDYLHKIYPKVRITLHAGELAPKLVPPEGLKFHIRESLELGHAERIGHGVDVMYERDAMGLLQEMARKKVLVEICLTSNDMILGVRGAEHPLPMYLKYGVPVAIATDDEGVARSDINHEYLRAIQTYALSYPALKQMSRHSLEYAFMPGASLWSDAKSFRRAACETDRPGASADSWSPGCRKFLDVSPRAQLQWKLEGEFAEFEAKVGKEGTSQK
ncbi:MAG: adenosine deaminase family protein [Terriglobales bacterium]